MLELLTLFSFDLRELVLEDFEGDAEEPTPCGVLSGLTLADDLRRVLI
jgi:hypothetical protein